MTTMQAPTFGELLRRYRVAAGLSQEALAEQARLSTRAISDLERGVKQTPRRDTIQLLVEALRLPAEDRAVLESTVHRRRGPSPALSVGAESSPLSASARQVGQLPAQTTPLLGREEDIAAARGILQRPEVRLFTLSGPSGVGKTRLGLRLAEEVSDLYADGAIFVPLAAIDDSRLVVSALAQALGLREVGDHPLFDSVAAFLREKHALLLLDNFEQVADASPTVARLLALCPRVEVVVTSRAALRVRGEHDYPVRPLDLPAIDTDRLPDASFLTGYAAIDLFVERARAADPHFVLTLANALAVAAICRRLDGLPLAIELAAARIKMLSPAALLARLEGGSPAAPGEKSASLRVLTGGARDLPARQQTMHNAVAWSYNLLSPDEQALFRRLAIFAGGGTLEAAEAVCTAIPGYEMDVFDGVVSLVDNSLLRRDTGAGGDPEQDDDSEPRLIMLQTIREYGLERLAESGELEQARRAHALYVLQLAEYAEPQLKGMGQVIWLARLAVEHDNIRAALHWAQDSGEVALGLRLASALWQFWYGRGHLTEGRAWLDSSLAQAEQNAHAVVPAPVRAKALVWAAALAAEQGDYERAVMLADRSLALYRELDDRAGIAWSLNVHAVVARRQGDFDRATVLYEESLPLYRELGDDWGAAHVLNNLGVVAYGQGDDGRAAALYTESLALFRKLENRWNIAVSLDNLGEVARKQGDDERAIALSEESLAIRRAMNDTRGIAVSLGSLGFIAREQGHYARAAALYRESLALYRQVGDKPHIAASLEGLAGAAFAQGQAERAGYLFGAAAALREEAGMPLPPAERAAYEQDVAAMRASPGGDSFSTAWQVGRVTSLQQAIERAMAQD